MGVLGGDAPEDPGVRRREPGRPVGTAWRDDQSLLAELPSAVDEHAVEVAVARLRSMLGRPGLVETVVKRGYRVPVTDR